MSDFHSTTGAKPSKPYPEFPLTPHPAGYWCKKIRGKIHYFGKWSDPDGALAAYLEQKDHLHAGLTPKADRDALTVKDLANRFLNAKQVMVDGGELSTHSWMDYRKTCDEIVAAFGKGRRVADLSTEDLAKLRKRMAGKWGVHRLAKSIQITRSLFKFALESDLIERPMKFGPGFARPSKKTIRLHKAAQDVKLFSREEILALMNAAGQPMRAMLLLAINAGLGNADCGRLRFQHVNFSTAMLNFPRPKTGIARRSLLWPETLAALRGAIDSRPNPKDEADSDLLFITKYGGKWYKDSEDNPISKEMRKLMDSLGIVGHRNFYTIRHTFRTIADETKDQPACDLIMGHESPHMATVYRERISDERLKAVAEYVRSWLFDKDDETKESSVNADVLP